MIKLLKINITHTLFKNLIYLNLPQDIVVGSKSTTVLVVSKHSDSIKLKIKN